MAPSPSLNPKVNRDAIGRAVDALLKWMRARAKQQKSQLLEHEDLLYLVLTLKRIPPKGRTNPYRIPLPHPLHPLDPSSTSICLFVDDRPNSALSPSAAVDLLSSLSLPISEVIGLSDLRSDYKPFEARRRLCDSYDLFFADRSILPLLPRLLGKHFFKKKKIPLAVDLSRPGWPEQIRQCCKSTLLYLRTGTCSGLKIGRVSQDREDIVENAMVAIEGAMEYVPKKWANIRSLHIKSVDSLALPIYQALPEMGLKIEGFQRKEEHRQEEDTDGVIFTGEEEENGEKKKVGSSTRRLGKKGGRIHEVDYMDSDLGIDADGSGEEVEIAKLVVEKRMRKKLKKDIDCSKEEKESDELGGKKTMEKVVSKNLKSKRGKDEKGKKDGFLNEDDDEMHLGDEEGEKATDELGMKKRMKKVRMGKVKKGNGGSNEQEGGEEKGAKKLRPKKVLKKERMEEDTIVKNDKKGKRDGLKSSVDDAPVADGVKKKSKTKKLEGRSVKKTKRSKLSLQTD